MTAISFEWDKKKNASNKKKHGVCFEEAQTVFVDENALLLHDPDHSDAYSDPSRPVIPEQVVH